MKRFFAYLKALLRHKWYVFLACLQLRVPLHIAILHDWDKFAPKMFYAYAFQFFDHEGRRTHNELEYLDFLQTWNRHQKVSKHHWQAWLYVPDSGQMRPLPMPDVYIREMLADWIGAGRAYGQPHTAVWYQQHKDRIQLDPNTRMYLEVELANYTHKHQNYKV